MGRPLDEQIRLLSMVDVFEALSREELEELGHRAPYVHLDEGDIFAKPQDETERLFVLERGRVQVYQVTPEGEEVTLSVVEGSNIFGEMVLIGQRLSGVYARALQPSVVCSLKRGDLERIILNHPEVGLKLVRHLCERLHEAEIRLADLSHKDVPARLASLILRLADGEGVVTNVGIRISTRYTHEQLGTMIGAKRVAVCRAFKRLREAEMVDMEKLHIYVRDIEALKRIAKVER